MKCINCHKEIPETSTVCPFCYNKIDIEKKDDYEAIKPTISFGDISSLNYDEKLETKDSSVFSKKKKAIIGGIVGVVCVLVIFIFIIMKIFLSSSESPYKLFNDTIISFFDFYIDNYTGSSSTKSGTYQLAIKINDKQIGFTGTYGLDTKNKLISLMGTIKDPREQEGGVILDYRDFNFDANLNGEELYFQSKQLFNNEIILFPIDDNTGLLTTKNYNLASLLSGIEDALVDTFKIMPYQSSKESINYLGENIKINKIYITLDNKGKLLFYKTFYTNLLENSNFINELSRIRSSSKEDIQKQLENLIMEVEYKYSGESDYQDILAIYYNNKKIYRIELDINSENTKKIVLDIGDTKYYLEYMINSESILSSTLSVTTKEKEKFIQKNYELTFDTDKFIVDINLEVQSEKSAKVKKATYETVKNIRDFTVIDYNNLKNNLNYYMDDVSWVDNLSQIFKNKCSPELNCRCEDGEELCICTYEGSMIKCPKNDVLSN